MKNAIRFLTLVGLSIGLTTGAFAQDFPGADIDLAGSVDLLAEGGEGFMPPAPPPESMPAVVAARPMFGHGSPFMGHCPVGHCGPEMMFAGLCGESSLSDDQLEKIYQIKESFLDKAGSKFAELTSQERAKRDLLTQADLDKTKVQAVQTRINGLKADLANLRLDEQVGMLGVLTNEQRKELRRNFVKRADFGPMAMFGRFKHCKKSHHE
ncbi:MAG: Spy/CpxP family protein refolding chaperone [Candidatus Obscuribacterales bacterium]|nr:Spy/CpxP family protein refolding chaperone [Candidatus Obscuribacterales bacterium]